VNSSLNPLTITMNSAMTLTANFAPTTTYYTLTTSVSPPGGGTIIPSCPTGVRGPADSRLRSGPRRPVATSSRASREA
jgi:hypothetical protein